MIVCVVAVVEAPGGAIVCVVALENASGLGVPILSSADRKASADWIRLAGSF
jgi:hypothetical protein